MRLARDADYARAVVEGLVPWWLDVWVTHAKQQQSAFAGALAAAVARAASGGAATAAEGAEASSSLPAAATTAPGGETPGTPNYRLLRSLLKAGAAQAMALAEVAQEAAVKGRVIAKMVIKMEE